MVPPIIFQIAVLFIPTLQSKQLVDNRMLTEDSLTQEYVPSTHQHPLPAISSPIYCRDFNYNSCHCPQCRFVHRCDNVVPVIQHEVVQPLGILELPKAQPWTPIRSFLLERDLRFHPNKIFVRQLIDNLQHGCSIDYTGPQFAYLEKNLLSAYQQPSVIDTTLQKEC